MKAGLNGLHSGASNPKRLPGAGRMHSEPGSLIIPSLEPSGPPAQGSVIPARGHAHAFRARFAYHPSRVSARFAYHPSRAHWPETAGGHHASSPGGPPGTARRPPGQGQMHPREEPRACIQSQVCLSSQPRQRQVCLSSQPRPHPLSPEVARMHSEPGLLIIPAASPRLGSRACV